MSGRKLEEKLLSIPEVKRIMESVKEKVVELDSDEGMTHFQEITYNYVNKFAKMSEREAKKIQKFLKEKYDFKEIYSINIVNIDPKTVPEIRMILEKSYSGKSLSDEELQDLLYQINELKV